MRGAGESYSDVTMGSRHRTGTKARLAALLPVLWRTPLQPFALADCSTAVLRAEKRRAKVLDRGKALDVERAKLCAFLKRWEI